MMEYNMSYLYASIFYLLLVLYHFLDQKKLDDLKSRMFLSFVLIGLLDIVFDIICTWMMSGVVNVPVGLSKMCFTFFYILQALIPFFLYYYARTLRKDRENRSVPLFGWYTAILCGMLILIVLNYWGGYFFTFNLRGGYSDGPLYMGMYLYAGVYVLLTAIDSIAHYRQLGKQKFFVICELLVIMGICVAYQYAVDGSLTTGLGIGLGMTVLYLNIGNPNRYIDSTTDVFDNRYFRQWLQSRMQRGKEFHIVAVEMHRIKVINKIFGNSFGDRVLIHIAGKMQEISGNDQVFRLNGKRMVIVTDSLVEYDRVRKEVLQYFKQELEIEGEKISCPVNICGITYALERKECDELIGYMDYLISLSAEKGRTTFIQGDWQTLQNFWYTKEIEQYLTIAVKNDLFEVYYQPIYSIKEKRFVALEALSRLRHPTLGLVSPEMFIQIAEKNGLILQIGNLQFEKVCRFVKAHPELMTMIRNVKFNTSPAEILQEGYGKKVLENIAAYHLPASFFQMEITETIATEYSENVYRIVDELVEAGVKLCLDDFGSGYANLNTVLRLPFTEVKLDRSLLNGIPGSEHMAGFYRSIVDMLKNMGYETVAEGVETESELELVSQWGVSCIQGYYFSQPLPEKEIVEFLRETYGE
ncbi:MAG TPA: EAL domain-containing protein [Candidatus Egerieimonas intestinavium]|uniref:EAL domain-containing protein n=1 Tax=Candidatus Egerieimonas intestinavium TaxID=2840777 RepID=A0A9D1EIY7_9FIRM|nr:EAL domain-containing protein [Candidatus Egerieimonas intestinavium]